ncbi:hypothetical protein PR202_gb23342 [Eleusine coracana subsp. coracana]|uniref:DUF6598 domain-containing protein n=1 Tax=Eleusine coracana subsp. coracana TaxID=191504 RepID=A0AAV5FJN6_ELECO|nr:hypothetical protein PR202_gb23342 [Eleusine coracana subsp. coracana]
MGFPLSWATSNPLPITLEETTHLRSKCFTNGPLPLPDNVMSIDTVQVFSVSVKEIKPEELGFHWPLQVYGFVVARDNDSSLMLTGPSRVVVAVDFIIIEIELKVKGGKESKDKVLSFLVIEHNSIFGLRAHGALNLNFEPQDDDNSVEMDHSSNDELEIDV